MRFRIHLTPRGELFADEILSAMNAYTVGKPHFADAKFELCEAVIGINHVTASDKTTSLHLDLTGAVLTPTIERLYKIREQRRIDEFKSGGTTVFVVMGESGEYSDAQEWTVKAFSDRSKATDLADKLNATPYDEGLGEHPLDPFCGSRYSLEYGVANLSLSGDVNLIATEN